MQRAAIAESMVCKRSRRAYFDALAGLQAGPAAGDAANADGIAGGQEGIACRYPSLDSASSFK
jgi:hypothetical protein